MGGIYCSTMERSWRRPLGIPTRKAENSEEESKRRTWGRRSLGVWTVPEVW